jgi:hypothetical protein
MFESVGFYAPLDHVRVAPMYDVEDANEKDEETEQDAAYR